MSDSLDQGKKVKWQYRITKKAKFDAAHRLMNYPGKCKNLHGHTWDVSVDLVGGGLNSQDMLLDFVVLKSIIEQVVDQFDHAVILNDQDKVLIDFFDKQKMKVFELDSNPTAEALARYIFHKILLLLAHQFPDGNGLDVDQVQVWESPTACATYHEEVVR